MRNLSFLNEEINHATWRQRKFRSGSGRLNLQAFECKLKLLKLRMGKSHFLIKPKIHVPGHMFAVSFGVLEDVGRYLHAYVCICLYVCACVCQCVCVCAQVHVYMRPACFAARPLPT